MGTRVWIYETVPGGRVAAIAEVSAIEEASPKDIWERHGDHAAISEQEFFWYFAGVAVGCAILLDNVTALRRPLSLGELRHSLGAFAPPQFYRRLDSNGAELSLFRSQAPNARTT